MELRGKKRGSNCYLKWNYCSGFLSIMIPYSPAEELCCRAAERAVAQHTCIKHWQMTPLLKLVSWSQSDHACAAAGPLRCSDSSLVPSWPLLYSSYTRHACIYHGFYYGFWGLYSMAQEVSFSFVSSKITQNQSVFSWDGNCILTSHLMFLCIFPPSPSLLRYILIS